MLELDVRGIKCFRAVRPYLTAAAVALMVALLVAAVHLTSLELQWTAFLAGVLVAAVLAMVSRASHVEWSLARRTAQLQVAKERFAHETRMRQSADAATAAEKARRLLIDEDLPAMLVYVDADERCQYCNAALCRGLGRAPASVEDSPLCEVFGETLYKELHGIIAKVRAGRTIHCERTLKMPSGGIYHVSAQFIPRFAGNGTILGFYVLLTDITDPADVKSREQARPAAAQQSRNEIRHATDGHEMYVESFIEQVTGWTNAGDRILSALENDEFRLYCQTIVPLAPRAGLPVHHEILIRLIEEEDNLMPPGTFLPIAEKFGLLPALDRWVLGQVVRSTSARARAVHTGATLFVNLSGATIRDPEFPAFVRRELQVSRMSGGAVCIELDMPDVISCQKDAVRLVRQLRDQGCHFALSGFGRDRVSFELLKRLKVDYLKIDGSLILAMLRNPVDLAKVMAIHKVAHANGLRTIAQHVEDGRTIARLREIGVDFAQGFGVSRPCPFDQMPATAH